MALLEIYQTVRLVPEKFGISSLPVVTKAFKFQKDRVQAKRLDTIARQGHLTSKADMDHQDSIEKDIVSSIVDGVVRSSTLILFAAGQ